MAASVTQTGFVRESVTLISGRPEHEGFDLEPILPLFPTDDDMQRGKEAHAEAMRREVASYFDGSSTTKAYDRISVMKSHGCACMLHQEGGETI
jgi:hypothetical protein